MGVSNKIFISRPSHLAHSDKNTLAALHYNVNHNKCNCYLLLTCLSIYDTVFILSQHRRMFGILDKPFLYIISLL